MANVTERYHEQKSFFDYLLEAFLGAFAFFSFLGLMIAGEIFRHGQTRDFSVLIAIALCIPYVICVAYVIFAPSSVKKSLVSARKAAIFDNAALLLLTAFELAAFICGFHFTGFLIAADGLSLSGSPIAAVCFFAGGLVFLSLAMVYYKRVKFSKRIHMILSLATLGVFAFIALRYPLILMPTS